MTDPIRSKEDTNVIEKRNVDKKLVGSVTELERINYLSPSPVEKFEIKGPVFRRHVKRKGKYCTLGKFGRVLVLTTLV